MVDRQNVRIFFGGGVNSLNVEADATRRAGPKSVGYGLGCWALATVSQRVQAPSTSTAAVHSGSKHCRRDGIRYSGTTAQGAEVCFTLTPDGSALIEAGFSFVRTSPRGLDDLPGQEVQLERPPRAVGPPAPGELPRKGHRAHAGEADAE